MERLGCVARGRERQRARFSGGRLKAVLTGGTHPSAEGAKRRGRTRSALSLTPARHAAQPRHRLLSRGFEKHRRVYIYPVDPFNRPFSLSLARNHHFFSELIPPPPLQIRPPPTTSGDEVWCGVLLELRRSRCALSRSSEKKW